MTHTFIVASCVLSLALVGCGDDSAPTSDAGTDSGGTDTGGTDTGGTDTGGTDTGGTDTGGSDTGGADAGEIVCDSSEVMFPTFDRSCTTPADCTIALHQSDCCGSFVALGISASERERFDAAEAICEPMWPDCRCAAQPTMADDGTTAALGGEPDVGCAAGTCTTTYPEG